MDKIYFSKVKQKAIIPSKELENAGYDFYACFDEDFMEIKPFTTKLIPTGIAWASSPKYYLQIEERSSTGSKGIKKSAGVVDSGYHGEIFIAVTNSNDKPIVISKLTLEELSTTYPQTFPQSYPQNAIIYPYSKAIAQGVVHEVPVLEIEEIPYEELLKIESKRGTGALGSSNK